MVSVEEALQIIRQNCPAPVEINLRLEQSLGYVLTKDVHSPIDMPPFNQSAMDGYALNLKEGTSAYQVIGEVAAGSDQNPKLQPGDAVRIFTGAAVPSDSNAVIQQEHVTQKNQTIELVESVHEGQNIRLKGEQLNQGELALSKGHTLTPASLGFLASLGIVDVKTFKKPRVGILITGNELVTTAYTLKYGQIYESNSVMLSGALKHYRFNDVDEHFASDDLPVITKKLSEMLTLYDVILISGGISVGDYDYVKTALEANEVKEHFHKIKQKPGKPIYFGAKENRMVFALPGNPASALTCFYMYVLPALNCLSGKEFMGLKEAQCKLRHSYLKKAGLAHFLKAECSGRDVQILNSQSSAMLNSFALSNALVFIPAATESINEGEFVTTYLL